MPTDRGWGDLDEQSEQRKTSPFHPSGRPWAAGSRGGWDVGLRRAGLVRLAPLALPLIWFSSPPAATTAAYWPDGRQSPKGTPMTTRPRAADDFPAIRARMEELRLEGAVIGAGEEPLPKRLVGRPLIVDNPRTPPSVRRLLLNYGRKPE